MTGAHESSGMRYGAIERADAIARGTLVAGGAYRVEHVIGRGGMAMVYAGKRISDGLDVALKIAAGPYASRPDLALRMQNEQSFAAMLAGHPNFVRPLDGGRLADQGDVPFLVTELVRGPALTDLIVMQHHLAPVRAARLALDVARALAALHALGVVHRDVKPDNIVVAKGAGHMHAKLIDFGLATRIEDGTSASPRLTQVFERPGTKHYMAPEQAMGAKPSPSFDVYALGVTLYEMLIGTPPFGERSAEEALEKKLSAAEPEISIAELRDDLPAALVEVVDRCLVRDPSRRIATAVLVEQLELVLEQLVCARPSGSDSDPGSVDEAAFQVRAAAAGSDAAVVVERRPARTWVVPVVGSLAAAGLLLAWVAGAFDRDTGPALDIEDPKATPLVSPESPAAVAAPFVEAPSTAAEVPPPDPPEPPPVDSIDEPPPSPTPQPTATSPIRKAKPSTTPVPAADSPECNDARDKAARAERGLRWRAVLELTATRSCWKDQTERRRMRVSAYFQLGQHEACLREARGSTHEEIAAFAALCESKVKRP